MNHIKLLCIVFTFLFCYSNSGISQNTSGFKRDCGFDALFQKKVNEDPTYLERYHKLQDFVNDFVAQHPNGYNPKSTITIPVVFHIILSASQSASFNDIRITQTITMLNRDFSGSNPHPLEAFSGTPSLKANTTIQFCIAQRTPAGAATNGIERRSDYTGNKWASGDVGMKHAASGGFDSWDVNKYLNVWVCDLVDGLCGFGILPVGTIDNEYGLVDDFEYTGHTGAIFPLDNNGTATHEIGHCFNLLHVWGNAGNCDSDFCNDTPPQNAATYGHPTGPQTDNCSPTAPGYMYTDFMDYSDDTTYANFTPDQKTRMLACFAPGGPLEQLTTSDGCISPITTLTCDFTESSKNICKNSTVTFTDQSTTPTTKPITSWKWTFAGGTPATSTVQNPVVTYSTIGTFTVTLVVTNSAMKDTLIKINDITVTNPGTPLAANFTGNPTTIAINSTVNFTDASTIQCGTTITGWLWTFAGGTPPTSTDQNPTGIQYTTLGYHTVSLQITTTGGIADTTKIDYINVLDSSSVKPDANFTADYTLLFVNGTTNFHDLSTGIPLNWRWRFYKSATTYVSSTVPNPTGIQYTTTGQYKVVLTVSNSNGSDSITKVNYITVIDSAHIGTLPPLADFSASQRLFKKNTAIAFMDESTNHPTSWKWYFAGATPSTSVIQNPTNIKYTASGQYQVCLKVSNPNGWDSLCKPAFIYVTDQYATQFCDSVENLSHQETKTIRKLTDTWGYLPGNNGHLIKAYAERYVDYTLSQITALIVPVEISKAGSTASYVRFKIWNGNTTPVGNAVTYKDMPINQMSAHYYKKIVFNAPVAVDGIFFAGFDCTYSTPQDTFVVSMADDRGPNGKSTLFALQTTPSNVWANVKDIFQISTSSGIRVAGCLINGESIEMDVEDDMLIYPNPSSNYINIEILNELDAVEIKVFDMLGRLVNVKSNMPDSKKYQLDFTDKNTGIYFIQIRKDDKIYLKKVSIIK